MMTLNANKLEQVVATALTQVSGNKRWTNAINRAADILKTNDFVHVQDDGTLLLWSESGEIYTAGRECRTDEGLCPAYAQGQPCKHRAAFKLLKRYHEVAH